MKGQRHVFAQLAHIIQQGIDQSCKRPLVLQAFVFAREDIWLELSRNSTMHTAMLVRGKQSVFAVCVGQIVLCIVIHFL